MSSEVEDYWGDDEYDKPAIEERYCAAVRAYEWLHDTTYRLIDQYIRHCKLGGTLNEDSIVWDAGFIRFTIFSQCGLPGCCPPEDETYSIPAHYLWSDDWIEKEKEKERLKKEANIKRKAEEDEKQRARAAKARRTQFENLKKEFGE